MDRSLADTEPIEPMLRSSAATASVSAAHIRMVGCLDVLVKFREHIGTKAERLEAMMALRDT